MSRADNEAVSVRLLDREYTVGVEPAERESLLAAAKVLDGKMREVRGGNRMAAVDRVAVLAALNLAHELEQLRASHAQLERDVLATVDSIERKLGTLADTSP